MESLNNLQELIQDLLQPIKQDPEAAILNFLGSDGKKIYLAAKGFMAMPFSPLKLDIPKILLDLISKLETLTPEQWGGLENAIRLALDGKRAEALEAAKTALQAGVVIDGSN